MLHDRTYDGHRTIGNAVDVDLGRGFQEAVDQHRAVGRHIDGLAHVLPQLAFLVNDHHRAAAEHEGRADQHRVADAFGDHRGFVFRHGGAGLGLLEADLVEQGGEVLAVLGQLDAFRRGADDRDAVALEVGGEVERGLATELDDHAVRLFLVADVEDVLEGQRLEEQLVGGVVVGRDGLGVRVHHDGLVAEFLQCEGGVDAAVVELDALADPVRTAAEDDDLLSVGLAGLVLVAVGRVEVRRVGLELRGAGVDQAVGRDQPGGLALGADVVLVDAAGEGDLAVGETEALGVLEVERGEVHALVGDLLEVVEEPRVDVRRFKDLVDGPAVHEGGLEPEDPLGIRHGELGFDLLAGDAVEVLLVEAEAPAAGFQRAQGFLHRLLEGAADRHRLADRLHRGREYGVRRRKLLEGEARDLGDNVVDGRLEGCRGLAGDVVREFAQRVADGQLGGDLGDREAGGLRGEGGRTRDARVHLDHDHPAVFRVDGELDVRAAGLDADLPDHGERSVAHDLVFAVGERLDRCDGDRVAGVDAHRVDVFDRTDDHAVVGAVAHDLHFEFLPAEQRFLDQDFGDGGEVDPAEDDLLELLAVVGDAAALAAEGEGGADDQREILAGVGGDLFGDDPRVLHVVRGAGLRHVEADLEHRVLEALAVLALVDGVGVGADHLHVVLVEHAGLEERHRGVERGLAAEGGQQGVGLLADDDFLHDLRRDRLDVGPVGELRIGHDGGRIGVHQDDLVAFLAQRLAGLDAGIIEFTALADDDGTGTDDEDFVERGVFGHGGAGVRRVGTKFRGVSQGRRGL